LISSMMVVVVAVEVYHYFPAMTLLQYSKAPTDEQNSALLS